MKEMWNNRYANPEYAYGTDPNEFFKYALEKLNIDGSILLPAEGEGRNAVYAAQKGLKVSAFDISEEGKKKAIQLANRKEVNIDYLVGNFMELDYPSNTFDCAALIYSHFPPALRSDYHQKINDLIKPGGKLIIEGFGSNHLKYRSHNPKVGGPDKLEMLFSLEMVEKDFKNFEIIQLEEKEIELNEGIYHIGTGSVIRFLGIKK